MCGERVGVAGANSPLMSSIASIELVLKVLQQRADEALLIADGAANSIALQLPVKHRCKKNKTKIFDFFFVLRSCLKLA